MATKGHAYTQLSDLKPGDTKYDVYGVVTTFTPARPTKGSDYMSSLTLIDPTMMNEGLSINVFAADAKGCPEPQAVGDIVRCHRLSIQVYKGQLQGVGRKKVTSYMIASGNVGDPYPNPPPGSTFTDTDREIIDNLRQWQLQHLANSATKSSYSASLSSILSSATVDITCQILGYHSTMQGGVIMHVWDGTDNPHLRSAPALPSHPALGTVIAIEAWPGPQAAAAQRMQVGQWATLRNIKCVTSGNVHFLATTEISSFLARAEQHAEVQALLSNFQQRCQSAAVPAARAVVPASAAAVPQAATATTPFYFSTGVGDMPTPYEESLSNTAHATRPVSLIAQILACDTNVGKWRAYVRVVDFRPSEVVHFTQPFCEECNSACPSSARYRCPKCNSAVSYRYLVLLRVADASGCLDVLLNDVDATQFFAGIPPTDLIENNVSCGALERAMEMLLETESWFLCCISSHTQLQTGERVHRMFDTMLIP